MPYADPSQQRAYQREWMAARRAEWFIINNRCVDCGSRDQLEVDHAERTKKINHRVWSWSQERRDEELAKCVARCKTHHGEKTARELSQLFSGQRNPRSKLADEQIPVIRQRAARGETKAAIARDLMVDRSVISRIVSGHTWSHS